MRSKETMDSAARNGGMFQTQSTYLRVFLSVHLSVCLPASLPALFNFVCRVRFYLRFFFRSFVCLCAFNFTFSLLATHCMYFCVCVEFMLAFFNFVLNFINAFCFLYSLFLFIVFTLSLSAYLAFRWLRIQLKGETNKKKIRNNFSVFVVVYKSETNYDF